jgi:hypothetical protein
MKCYSIEFRVPDVRPFYAQETWFQPFMDSVYSPIRRKTFHILQVSFFPSVKQTWAPMP